MSVRRLPPLLLACTLAAACATPVDPATATPPTSAAGESVVVDEAVPRPLPRPIEPKPEPVPGEPPMACDAGNLAWAVGLDLDTNLIERIRVETGSERVRVLKPGMMATMDYREDRVNIDVDDDDRVLRVRCG